MVKNCMIILMLKKNGQLESMTVKYKLFGFLIDKDFFNYFINKILVLLLLKLNILVILDF